MLISSMQTLSTMAAIVLLFVSVAAADGPSDQDFKDPAPPQVSALQNATPPEPEPHPNGRFFKAPKPLSKTATSRDWPMFQGSGSVSLSAESELLATFPEEGLSPIWECARGQSYAAPTVSRGRVIHFHRVGNEEVIESLQAETGKRFWIHSYPSTYRDPYNFGTGPKAAPVIFDDVVVTFGIEGRLTCLDWETGQLLWERKLLEEFEVPEQFFGLGASPLAFEDKIILNLGGLKGPTVAAFEKSSGRLAWGCGATWGPSYSSPVLTEIHAEPRVLVLAGGKSRPPHGGLMCLDPRDGSLDFSQTFRGRRFESANAASPIVMNNRVMVTSSYNTGSLCLEIDETFKAKEAFRIDDFGSHFCTGYVEDEHYYGIDGAGSRAAALVCLEWASGEEVWRKRLDWDEIPQPSSQRQKGLYGIGLGSLLRVDGRTLALGDSGHLLWLELTPEGAKILDRTWLFSAHETWTPPVISHGLLYVCQNQPGPDGPRRLLCFDFRKTD